MANVVFDEESARRIAAAVKWVEQYSLDESTEPESEDDPSADSAARTVIRGTFSGEWNKGTEKTVDYTADNGDSATQDGVYNYFADVGESGQTTDCLIMQAGSEWVLVSAEAKPFLAGTFDGAWSKGAYKTVTTNNSGTVNVLNLFADVNDNGDSGVSCAIARDGLWYLIAAECS